MICENLREPNIMNHFLKNKHTHFEPPEKPLLFAKAPSALNGPRDPVILPQSCGQVDWEVELAVVVGREGKRIAPETAFDHIAGYTCFNDVSDRDAQYSDRQYFRGKSIDTGGPSAFSHADRQAFANQLDRLLSH